LGHYDEIEAIGIVEASLRPVLNQRTDRVLFGWLLLASLFGILAGVPWTLAIFRDHPGTAWWREGAFDLLFLTAASAAGTWLGKRVDLGSGLRELVLGTPGCWKHMRSALVPGTLVGLGTFYVLRDRKIPWTLRWFLLSFFLCAPLRTFVAKIRWWILEIQKTFTFLLQFNDIRKTFFSDYDTIIFPGGQP